MIDADLLAQAHDVAMAVAPELSVRPLYLVPPGESPWLPPKVACAVACKADCPQMRDDLESRGKWHGSGPWIAFVQQFDNEHDFWALFLHELAHILPADFLEVVSTPETRAEAVAEMAKPGQQYPNEPGWTRNHGSEWLRICCHLYWRFAIVCNRVVLFNRIYDPWQYDLSSAGLYLQMLDNEPLLMRDKTFAEIVETQKPPAFAGLFQSDYDHWLEAHPQPTKEKVA